MDKKDYYEILGVSKDATSDEIKSAFAKQFDNNKPKVIIANTVKGYGIPFMENDILWHYRYPHDGDEYKNAISELNRTRPIGALAPCEVKK